MHFKNCYYVISNTDTHVIVIAFVPCT